MRHQIFSRFITRPLKTLIIVATLIAARPVMADLDVVFVIDTTGSMVGEIREVQERVRQLANSLAEARPGETLRFGVVAYRDHCDTYVTQHQDLTESVATADAFLSGLKAEGGGDGPESVIAGIDTALHEMTWNLADGVDRRIFLIGDAPPHLDYPEDPQPETLITRARSMGIVINTIGCRSLPPQGVYFFRLMAYSTEGSYQHIGRVQAAGSGELTEAVSRTILAGTRVSMDSGRELPVDWLEHREATSSVISVRQGGPEGVAQSRESEGLSPCNLSILLPPEFALESPPRVRLINGRLRVELSLIEGPGGLDIFSLEDCPPWTTPIDIVTEGS